MPVTRRTFLGTAGASLITRNLLRADDDPEVRVAVIGAGARGSDLIRALTTLDGVDLAGVCDDYPPHLEQGAKYAGPKTKTFASYRRLLDELKPQAVAIAVPLHAHYQIASDCLSAGCDVFRHRPLTARNGTRNSARHDAPQCRDPHRPFGHGHGFSPPLPRSPRAVLTEFRSQGFELTTVEHEALASMDSQAMRTFAQAVDRRIQRVELPHDPTTDQRED